MLLGDKIRELRIERELLQRELAQQIHIASNTLSQFESGKAKPSYEVLISLADFFEVSIDYLLGRSDDFGNVTVIQNTDKVDTLSADEQRLIDTIRKNPPYNTTDWLTLYAELPFYMQEKIFAELKGMHLGYKTAKARNVK